MRLAAARRAIHDDTDGRRALRVLEDLGVHLVGRRYSGVVELRESQHSAGNGW